MAYQPNGQQHGQYAAQYGNVPSLSSQQTQIPLQRTSSFDAGDDRNYFEEAPQSAHPQRSGANTTYSSQGSHGGGYANYPGGGSQGNVQSNLGSRHSQFSVGSSQHSVISQTSSHGSSAMSGYQHHYQPPVSVQPSQPAYNPQQYAHSSVPAQTQSAYNPQAYTPTATTPYSSSQNFHYNPAAYQSPTTSSFQSSPNSQWQSTASGPPYGYSPQSQYPSSPTSQPPPPPPRSHSTSISGHHSSSQYSDPYARSHGYQNLPPQTPASPSMPTTPYSPLPPIPQTSPITGYNADPNASDPANRPSSNRRYSEIPQQSTSVPNPPPHNSSSHDLSPQPLNYGSTSGRSSFSSQATRMSFSSQYQQSTAAPMPPAHQSTSTSPRRTDTLSRHPQSRPLPGPPADSEPMTDSIGRRHSGRVEPEVSYEEIMKEVEAAVREGRSSASRRQNRYQLPPQEAIQQSEEPQAASALSPRLSLSPDEQHTHTNGQGHISSTGTGQYVNYDAYSDDSDAEAAAGVAALQIAEEEEAAFRSRANTNASVMSSYGSTPSEQPPPPPPALPTPRIETSSDSDYANYDMGLYGGGYDAQMQYGDNPSISSGTDRVAATSGSFRSSGTDDKANNSSDYEYPSIDQDSIHPFPEITSPARVDAVGTGGLADPNLGPRRLSFEDGDEGALAGDGTRESSISEAREPSEPQDLFFHPGMSSRPLPPAPAPSNNLIPHLMPAGTYRSSDQMNQQYDQYGAPTYPATPEEFTQAHLTPSTVPRSTSLSTHTTTPRTDPIIRSKTDADRLKQKQISYESSVASPTVPLDLPSIPTGRRKKFNPSKLSSEQFRKCTEPWALSSIVAWVRDLSEDETDLRIQAVANAIVALFTHKVPTMNTADAETLGDRVVTSMLNEGALIREEEWVKFGAGTLSGVLWQITGQGCYSSRLHIQETEVFGRCYSHHCMRTLKKINLKTQAMEPQKKTEDWATFYQIGKDIFDQHPKKEIDRQNNLHEIVTTEDAYISQLDVLQTLYRDQLGAYQPAVINPKRVDKFLRDVFGKVDAVKKVNEDYLLAQLKYRQKEQGPFISGFSDIFREWIRKARVAYVDYAATFPNANYLVRREAETNMVFRQFLNQARENKISQRLSWDTYLKSPITRIQRYTLLLSTVYKNMVKDSEEKANLLQAIEEIKLVAMECDAKVGEGSKKVDLKELSSKLKLRPYMKREVELNLEHLGREIIHQGDLQRPRTKRFNWVDTRVILFDHYLVLAKIITTRDTSRTVKYESYDVSKLPIPMDLLVLESTNDDAVMKSSVKGITSAKGGPADVRGGNINVGANASVTTTVLESSKEDKILYPFKIKHLGKSEIYTLYASSSKNRQEWCEKIIEAKTKHAASLYAQHAEPFRLRVLSDSAFAYSDHLPQQKTPIIKGTPLYRAVREVEKKYEGNLSRPLPICRAAVNCATVFQQPPGRSMCAIGTDYGVFISEYDNPRGWKKAISMLRVTQVAVFEEFNLFLLIADKSLIAYHLDIICPASGTPAQNDSSRRAPQKLSGNREVGFFAAGRMKDRALVLYKKRDGISSTFKVLEPVLQKSAGSRARFLPRRGQTEFFREYDEFYIPADSYNINLFHSSLAISTSRGIEVLTLDKKQPWSVPNLRSDQPEVQTHLSSIANRIKDLRPLGMFRLSESEFLVAFQECAVYVNKHGDVSRSVVMEFVGSAHSACLCGKFLILVNDDFIEIRNAMNGRMRQVIAGRNVVLLDDGGNSAGNSLAGSQGSNFNEAAANNMQNGVSQSTGFSTRSVKVCMQHPEHERSQIVLELAENQGQKD